MLFQHFDWDLTHQVLLLYIYFAQPSYEHERPALENAHTLVQRTDIFSCKFSAKVSLMLGNPFLCKLNHINLCFIQISTKSPAKLLIPFRESTVFFEVIPVVLGRSVNFNIKISTKTARVSRLSVPCDYDLTLDFAAEEMAARFCLQLNIGSLFWEILFKVAVNQKKYITLF